MVVKARGVSLIEVLVTLFIVAIGLLGFTKLQIGSLDLSVYAHQRSTATVIMHDLIERIRNNPGQLEAYIDTVSSGAQPEASSSDSTGDITFVDKCNGTACSAEEMAVNDVQVWHDNMLNSTVKKLPNPQPSLTCEGEGKEAVCEIAIYWEKKHSIWEVNASASGDTYCNVSTGSEGGGIAPNSGEKKNFQCVKIMFRPDQFNAA